MARRACLYTAVPSRLWGFSNPHICHLWTLYSYMDHKAYISGLQTLHFLLCLPWLLCVYCSMSPISLSPHSSLRSTGVTNTPVVGFSSSGQDTSSGTCPGLSLKVNLHSMQQAYEAACIFSP